MNTEFAEVLSADTCPIRYEVTGSGPTIILVDGALCSRAMGPSAGMSQMLVAQGFRVARFDRRGRGESGFIGPYDVQREVEDIGAIASHLGGQVNLWGMSSGGLLALLAASRLSSVQRVAIYEGPTLFDSSRPPMTGYWHAISERLAQQNLNGALKAFLEMVGVPAPIRFIMRMLPVWRQMRALAPTLLFDRDIVAPYQTGDKATPAMGPALSGKTILISAGDKSPDWLRSNNQQLAALLPGATFSPVVGDDHMVRPAQHQELLTNFFRQAVAEA